MKPVTRYAAIARLLLRRLSEGDHEPIDQTIDRALHGEALETVSAGPNDRLELSVLDADDRTVANDFFGRMAAAYGTKKTGVSGNGLALLLAYCVEGMQQAAANSEQVEP